MITYSTNWMGPVSTNWYKDRGLTKREHKILEHDSIVFPDKKKGDIFEFDEIIEHYSGGRIDVMGTDELFGTEISLPVMKSDDWSRFSHWILSLETETVWTLKEIVDEYEKTNPKITWAKEILNNII